MDSKEQSLWVFRHVGPPASTPDAVEVVELKQGSISFGRGANVDVYIDSLVLRNFISRRHAVVVGEADQDQQLQFTLFNHGLNGTYINDVRIGDVHCLQEGDRVTFGHKNGYKVKVGETALQPESEFQFVLERCQRENLSMAPRQELKQYGGTDKGKASRDADTTETSSAVLGRSELAVSGETNLQFTNNTVKKKGLDQQNSCEDLSNSPSETQSPKMRKTDHSLTNGTKYKSFADIVLPKPRETCATKEHKKSKTDVPRDNTRQLNDDVPISVCSKSKQHSEQLPASTTEITSVSNIAQFSDASAKENAQHKLTSPSQNTRTSLRHLDKVTETSERRGRHAPVKDINKSKTSSDKSKSSNSDRSKTSSSDKSISSSSDKPQTSVKPKAGCDKPKTSSDKPKTSSDKSKTLNCDSLGNKSLSTVKCSPGESWPVLSRHDISDSLSMSSKPAQLVSGAQNVTNKSCSPGQRQTEGRPVSPELLDRPRSPGSGERRSSVYDEPPVLTPEYVKTPSSSIHTPSPHSFTEKRQENYDEVDDIDREDVFCSIPPTPRFHKLSPSTCASSPKDSPQHNKRDNSPRNRSKEVSLNRKTDCVSSTSSSNRKERTKICDTLSKNTPHLSQNNRSLEKKTTKNCRDQKEQTKSSSQKQMVPPEPDSTTSNDSFDSNRREENRKPDKHHHKHKSSQFNKSGHNNDTTSRSQNSSSEVDSKSKVKDNKKEFRNVMDRNVFEKFSPPVECRSALSSERKRYHSVDTEETGDHSARPPLKTAKQQKSCMPLEKENGLIHDTYSGVKQTKNDEKAKLKRLTDGHMLKDVKVSIQRVSSEDQRILISPEKDLKNRSSTRSTVAADKTSEIKKQHSSTTRDSRLEKKNACEQKDSPDTSLFGMEMEKLGKMQLKERKRTFREKCIISNETDKAVSTIKNSREKSKRIEKNTAEMNQNIVNNSVLAQSREKRSPRTLISRSQSPEKMSGADKDKPGHKMVTRRLKQGREEDGNDTHQTDNNQEQAKANCPPKKRRRQRKKRDSEAEDDDESLEEGVTWYDEDTCASDSCYRPADRRVQWVCCDDCDSWYHTVCVGIFLEDLQEEDDYHCGCVLV